MCRNIMEWRSKCGNRTWRRRGTARVYWFIPVVWLDCGPLVNDRYWRKSPLPNLKCHPRICMERVRVTASNCRLGLCISGPAFFDGNQEYQRRRMFAFVHLYPALPSSWSSIAALPSSSSDPSLLHIPPVSPISSFPNVSLLLFRMVYKDLEVWLRVL
jgi:hypothetical protein